MLITSSDQETLTSSAQHAKANPRLSVLPQELHDLVLAGISNAIHRAIMGGNITLCAVSEEELMMRFLDELCAPYPQIPHFIRYHDFILSSLAHDWRQAPRDASFSKQSSERAQRQYEQEVYDFSRNLGLPVESAVNWVFRARKFYSDREYDSTDTEQRDIAESLTEVTDQIHWQPLLQSRSWGSAEYLDQAPGDGILGNSHAHVSSVSEKLSPFTAPTSAGELTSKGKDKAGKTIRLPNQYKFEGTEQPHQRQSQELEVLDSASEGERNMPAALVPSVVGDETLVDSVAGQCGELHSASPAPTGATLKAANIEVKSAEAVAREKQERNAKKAVKKARKALAQAEEQANKLAGKPFEDKEISQEPKKRKEKRKRKSNDELPLQSEVQSKDYHTQKKSRGDSEAQDVKHGKPKRKKRGPEQSPFFQRSNSSKAKKQDASEKTEKMDFQLPMIQ